MQMKVIIKVSEAQNTSFSEYCDLHKLVEFGNSGLYRLRPQLEKNEIPFFDFDLPSYNNDVIGALTVA